VAIFGVISGTQFWLLANEIYNAREAKRLFGLIGAGAISGGIFGGYLTSFLAPRLSTENMIFFCVGFLMLCQIFVWSIWKKTKHLTYTQKATRPKQMSQARAQASWNYRRWRDRGQSRRLPIHGNCIPGQNKCG
jgi:ATP/ADP translocase